MGVTAISVTRATFLCSCNAKGIPIHLTAKWVQLAYACRERLILATGGEVHEATSTVTGPTLRRTVSAVLIAVTGSVSTESLTLVFNALFVRRTSAVLSTRAAILSRTAETISTATLTFTGQITTERIPVHVAAIHIHIAYTGFDFLVFTSGCVVLITTGATT